MLMRIRSVEADKIVEIVMNILKKKSIKYKITNKDFRPKEGELPQIKIDEVEEEINKYEVTLRLQENVNQENVSYLMELYEKAVQYYSAVNDNKYELYMGKIQDMFSNEQFTKLLNEKKKNNIKDIDKNYYNKNKEEKKDDKKEEKKEDNNNNKKENINIIKEEKEEKKQEKKEEKKEEIKEIKKEEKKAEVKLVVEGNIKKSDLDFESDDEDDD